MKNKRRYIIWAIIFILAAVAVILDGMGIKIKIGVAAWQIILGSFLVYAGVEAIVGKDYWCLPIVISLLFLLFQHTIFGKVVISAWAVLIATILLSVGIGLLTKGFKKKPVIVDNDAGRKIGEKSVMYVDATDLNNCSLESNLGSMDVFIENPNAYTGNGCINIENNLGAMNIHVPSKWHVVMQVDNSLGAVKCPPNPNGIGGPVLVIRGENNLGSVNIIFEG